MCFKGKQARSSSICMLCPVKFGVDRFVDIAGEACAFESFEQRLETRQFCAMEIKCSDVIRCLLPGVPCSLVGHTNQQTCKTNTIKEENVELRSPPFYTRGQLDLTRITILASYVCDHTYTFCQIIIIPYHEFNHLRSDFVLSLKFRVKRVPSSISSGRS